MLGFASKPVDSVRSRAIGGLDRRWPVGRGVDVDQADARAAIARMTGLHPSDEAAADAVLLDLWCGGLLERHVHPDRQEYTYRRPILDVEPHADRGPSPVMFHPGDGSEPRPYAEYTAAREA